MVIQELKPSKRVEGRWLVVLEDGSILRVGENEMISFSLYTGKQLSEEEAQKLLNGAKRSALKERTIELLSRKPQSRWEMERKLKQWEAGEEETRAICDRMEELGFLDDAQYAQRVVRHYSAKGFGERKLRDELYRRGIPRELWQQAMEQQDSGSHLDSFIAKKLAGKPMDRQNMKKVSDALARRGYRWSEINEAMRRFGAGLEENDGFSDDIFE